jgi:flagellum-specific peptidoglycan hydrolase FlgJ
MNALLDFVTKYYKDALESEKQTGVPALFTLAQAALESGYGKKAPGNNFFGIKAGKSWKGKKQLLVTHEVLSTPNNKSFPEIISVVPIEGGKYRYKVKDYFRLYDTPAQGFTDHGNFLKQNRRYTAAFQSPDAKAFASTVAKAGYATATNYEQILHKQIDTIKNNAAALIEALKKN